MAMLNNQRFFLFFHAFTRLPYLHASSSGGSGAGSALVSPALPASLIRYAPEGRTGAFMGSPERKGRLEKKMHTYIYIYIIVHLYYCSDSPLNFQ